MPELTPQERLQPSLLDRLTDEEPERKTESRDRRVLSLDRLRESVIRDLGWLLNACHLEAVQKLDEFPEVKRSTLNYGMVDLTGIPASGVDVKLVEKMIRDTVLIFEPRILERTLVVKVEVDRERMSHKAIIFRIEGELWAQPLPLQLYLKTEVDLELGNISVAETSS